MSASFSRSEGSIHHRWMEPFPFEQTLTTVW